MKLFGRSFGSKSSVKIIKIFIHGKIPKSLLLAPGSVRVDFHLRLQHWCCRALSLDILNKSDTNSREAYNWFVSFSYSSVEYICLVVKCLKYLFALDIYICILPLFQSFQYIWRYLMFESQMSRYLITSFPVSSTNVNLIFFVLLQDHPLRVSNL